MKKNQKLIILGGGLLVLLLILFVVFIGIKGRSAFSSSPSDLTESYLKSYQNEKESVVKKIEYPFDDSINDSQIKRFKEIMKRQYRNMTYTMVNEEVNETDAIVEVHVMIKDLKDAYEQANLYTEAHPEDFKDDDGEYDEGKAIDYKLSKMEDSKEKIEYAISFHFSKDEKNKWKMEDLSDVDLLKINGLF